MTVCIRVQKLLPFSFNDFYCFHFLLLTSNDGWKPQSVKTTLMLLQHVGTKLASSFYKDSVSTSQHLKNVSYRSYDLAHCRNHRKFKVLQLAKHHNDTRPLSILLSDRSFTAAQPKHGTYSTCGWPQSLPQWPLCLLRLNAKGPSEDNPRASTYKKSFNYYYTVYTCTKNLAFFSWWFIESWVT